MAPDVQGIHPGLAANFASRQTALERAESTAPRKMEPLLGGQSPRGGTIAEHGESSADEGPDVPRRTQEARGVGHHVSYLSTATTARSRCTS